MIRAYSIFTLIVLFKISGIQAYGAYDPNAGYIISHTQQAKIYSGSNSPSAAVVDLNTSTYWESEALLPDGYISRAYLNVFHPGHPQRLTSLRGPGFDGNLNSMQLVNQKTSDGKYKLEIPFNKADELIWLSAKIQAEKPVSVSLKVREGWRFSGILSPEQNYMLTKLIVPSSVLISGIVFESEAAFGIFELAGLVEAPWDYLAFDFGNEKEIGQVWSRHLSGENVVSIALETSNDGKNWKNRAHLHQGAVGYVATVLPQKVMARWLRIRYQLNLDAYGKAICWELHAYDRYGPFGKPAPFVADRIPLGSKLGINAVWGWGYNNYSDQIPSGAGIEKFSPVFSKARNYHELLWDISRPGERAAYEAMHEKGTQANWWLDWEREYQNWIEKGIQPTAAIQFTEKTVPSELWNDPQKEAWQYGKDFAAFFGSSGKKMIQQTEIGNEPWDYPEGFYPHLLLGMAAGLKEADPAMTVLPAAFQATFPKHLGHLYNNYASDIIHPLALNMLDGINAHFYAHLFDADGNRKSVYPEHPANELNGIRNIIRWRDNNMPNKPVFVTEFGYDSEGADEACTHNECVSEAQQAAWGLRAFLILARAGVAEAYWYFFANEFTSSFLHTRSGLLGSVNTGFVEKQSFLVFRQFVELCADYHIAEVIQENKTSFAYLLQNAEGKKSMLVWNPENESVNQVQQMGIALPFHARRYIRIDGNPDSQWFDLNDQGFVQLPVNGFPLLIE